MTQTKPTNRNITFFIYAGGIFVFYFYYGILQEKITKQTYGEEGEKFHFFLSLVFFQCIINAIYAKIMLAYILEKVEDHTTIKYYASSSLTYLSAMLASNMALQWVSYPTQVVGKSCKPIPVMILGVLIGRKSYSLKKYLFIFTIVIGVSLFMFKDKATSKETSVGLGELMLIFSLAMDGLTGAVQERMLSEYKTKSGHMMFNMNLWSIGYLSVGLLGTGELFSFLSFVHRFPYVIVNLFTFSMCSAIGQFFIFLMVSEFGPLPCSIATTTRKFFTVLGSVIFFGNVLTSRQWLGAVLVFMGLTLDALFGKKKKSTKIENSK